MIDFLGDCFFAVVEFLLRPWVIGVLAVVAFVLLLWGAERSDNRRCQEIMALARTSRDSLDAKIACERIHDNTTQAIAIGAAAGAIAGSRGK
jgi:hypothetical protein